FGVGVKTAVADGNVGDGQDEYVGDELAVEGFDAIALFEILLLAPFVERVGEIGGGVGFGVEIVDGGGGVRGRRGRGGGDVGLTGARDEISFDISLEDAELFEIFDDDEVGGVAYVQLAVVETVMLYWIDTGRAEDLEHVDAARHRAGAQLIDVTGDEAVRMFVVAAKHHLRGPVVEQGDQGPEVLCGAAFTDENLHSLAQFVEGFIGRKTFVIGADAGGNIIASLFAAETGSMTVDGKLKVMRRRDLFHDFGIFVQHAGEIHHFAEILYIGHSEQPGDGCGIEGGSGGLETGGGDAAGRPEIKIEGD